MEKSMYQSEKLNKKYLRKLLTFRGGYNTIITDDERVFDNKESITWLVMIRKEH